MPLPTGVGLEIEFVRGSGVWTDVSADVQGTTGLSLHYGRNSEYTDATAATATFTLDNQNGQYSPDVQLLIDGVTAHPYWPNIQPRRRVRAWYTVGGVRKYRYFGYIKAWQPVPDQGDGLPKVQVQATCRLDQFGRLTANASYLQAILSDAPFALWQNTEVAGSTYALDQMGTGSKLIPIKGVDGAAVWGTNNPVAPAAAEGLTALSFTPGSTTAQAQIRATTVPGAASTAWTIEFWAGMTGPGVPLVSTIVGINVVPSGASGYGGITFSDHKNGGSDYLSVADSANPAGVSSSTGAGTPSDGLMHHYAITGVDNGSTYQVNAYIDGVLNSQVTAASGGGGLHGNLGVLPAGRSYAPLVVNLTVSSELTNGAQNVFGPIALYSTALSSARIAAHAALGLASSQTTGWRVAEYLHWAGVAATEMSVATGKELVAVHPTAGKTVLQLVQEMVTTEGGGAVCYTDPTGLSTFLDRTFRKPGAALMTLDAEGDLDGSDFQPSLDELNLVTRSTVQRNGGNSVTFIDTAAESQYGTTNDGSPTSYGTTDAAALFLAQARVRSQSTPKLRLASLTIDLETAQTNGLDGLVAQMAIGSRIRTSGLARGLTPTNSIDTLAEGWTETIGTSAHTVKLDCSPADNPPRFVLNDATYGRLNTSSSTLQSLISAAASTVVIATASGPTFTTNAAMYPLNIRIGSEVLTLTAAPSGSASPQTFTGVLRGQSGTQSAQQAAGSVVKLYPAATVTL